jgi:hypothetical protein
VSQAEEHKRRLVQKKSARVGCICRVDILQKIGSNDMTITYQKNHSGHQLGSAEDITYLKLDPRRKHWLKEKIAEGLLQHGRYSNSEYI